MLKVTGQKIYMTRADSAKLQAVPKIKREGQEEPEPYILEEGDRIVFRLKRKADDSYEVICEKDCEINLTRNQAILTLVPEDTENCEFKEHRYEFELITYDDYHSTFVENQPFTIGKELEKHAGV